MQEVRDDIGISGYTSHMAKIKQRKRAYIPPPNEASAKQTSTTTTRKVSTKSGSGGRAYYTAPNGRKMPVPAKPGLKRSLTQIPLYFIAMAVVVYLTTPKGTTTDRLLYAATQALILSVVFLPMLYWLDRMRYRRYETIVGASSKPREKAAAKVTSEDIDES